MPDWTPDALRAEVASRTWFHTIDLGNGIVTPGEKDTPTELGHFRIPDDLTGKSVLDVGALDGFYSFEAERRGAVRVVAADHWSWTWPGSDGRRNFELAREVLASRVEPVVVPVEELSPERAGGVFDVVLFLGVLYHAPDPIGYLRNVRSVTAGMAIVETVTDLMDIPVPAAAYYPGDMLNHDGSNHFGPNALAVEGMLREAGFSRVTAFPPWTASRRWNLEPSPGGQPWRRPTARLRRRLRSGRTVFHAIA